MTNYAKYAQACKDYRELKSILSSFRNYRDRLTIDRLLVGNESFRRLTNEDLEIGLEGFLDKIAGTIYNFFHWFVNKFEGLTIFFDTFFKSDIDTASKMLDASVDDRMDPDVFDSIRAHCLKLDVSKKVTTCIKSIVLGLLKMLDDYKNVDKFRKDVKDIEKAVKEVPGVFFYADDVKWEINTRGWINYGFIRNIGMGHDFHEFIDAARERLARYKELEEVSLKLEKCEVLWDSGRRIAEYTCDGNISTRDMQYVARALDNVYWFIAAIFYYAIDYDLKDPIDAVYQKRGYKNSVFTAPSKVGTILFNFFEKNSGNLIRSEDFEVVDEQCASQNQQVFNGNINVGTNGNNNNNRNNRYNPYERSTYIARTTYEHNGPASRRY